MLGVVDGVGRGTVAVMAGRRGGLGPMGGAWARAAAAHHVHQGEAVDGQVAAAGTLPLLTPREARDVLAVLEAAVEAAPRGSVRDRVDELYATLKGRMECLGLD